MKIKTKMINKNVWLLNLKIKEKKNEKKNIYEKSILLLYACWKTVTHTIRERERKRKICYNKKYTLSMESKSVEKLMM